LYRAPGIQLYSFQVGDRAKECRPLNPLILDLSPKIRNFVDTAAFLKEMDVVVTVCTSLAHLAGTMGIRTHIVLPRRGQHFVWEHEGDTTLWYDSVVLHRQETAGDWASVLQQVSEVI
jgi:ADP-heptose:LPS heptosyltransferase